MADRPAPAAPGSAGAGPAGEGTEPGRPDGPLIVACLRCTDLRPNVDPVTGAVRRHPLTGTAAPAEWAALEIALRVAGAWDGRVLALTAGPPAAETVLREALAVGAEAVRVQWPDGEPGGDGYLADLAGDERALAAALAGAAGPRRPALVLCGDRSADRGTGAMPAFLAHELGASQALGLVSLEVADGQLLAQRRLPGGRRERLRVPVPAVCSVEAAGVRLRRAPLPAMLAAQRAVIPVATAGAALRPVRVGSPRPYAPRTHAVPDVPAGTAHERLLALSAVLTQREPPVVISPASASAAAGALLGYLHRAGYDPRAEPARPAEPAAPAAPSQPAAPIRKAGR
jgi:electron transfer flavoprotein beta subunit